MLSIYLRVVSVRTFAEGSDQVPNWYMSTLHTCFFISEFVVCSKESLIMVCFKKYKEKPHVVTFSVSFSDDGIVPHGRSITDFRPRSPSPPPRTSAPPHLESLTNPVIHYNSLSPPLSPAVGNHTEGEDPRLAMVLTEINGNHVVSGNQANMAAAGAISTNNELNKWEIAEIRKHNLHVRMLVYREVRRPGRSKYALHWFYLKTDGDLLYT